MTTQILIGDVRERLAGLPDDHFDCVVTSPPYWGLRDYNAEGQIGLERTLGEHIEVMVGVFREVRRVLKPTGVCFVNYGDCYATSPNGRSAADTKSAGTEPHSAPILKPKDLCMVPNRLAIALQEDGWWVRSEIIWAKPNPMPESVKDRPGTSHEKIWLLTKSAKYFYDAAAVARPAAYADSGRSSATKDELDPDRKRNGSDGNAASFRAITETRNLRNYEGESAPTRKDKQRGHSRRHAGFNDLWDQMTKAEQQENGRNLRNYEPAPLEVWPIATSPFPGAHFATFPQALVERALKAGCPIGGLVLDPFGGAGTVGLVAGCNQRNAVLIELNEDYAQMARERIDAGVGLFNHIDFEPPPVAPKRDERPVADQRLAERVRRGHQ